jgi:hypothetical protein
MSLYDLLTTSGTTDIYVSFVGSRSMIISSGPNTKPIGLGKDTELPETPTIKKWND